MLKGPSAVVTGSTSGVGLGIGEGLASAGANAVLNGLGNAPAGLTKTVALEAAEDGVTVNAVVPGHVPAPLGQAQVPDTARARGITAQGLRGDVLVAARSGSQDVTIDPIAPVATHLCGPAAASVTGAVMPVDAGWTAR